MVNHPNRAKMPTAIALECARRLVASTRCGHGGPTEWTMRTVDDCCDAGWEVRLDAPQDDFFPVTVVNMASAYRAHSRRRA